MPIIIFIMHTLPHAPDCIEEWQHMLEVFRPLPCDFACKLTFRQVQGLTLAYLSSSVPLYMAMHGWFNLQVRRGKAQHR